MEPRRPTTPPAKDRTQAMQEKQTRSQESGVRSQARSFGALAPSRLKPQAARLSSPQASSLPLRPAFTLTELLIVIAIIAVLAGLIAAAAVNAMRSANRARITLEIKNVGGALENFKNDFGAYPPNGMNPTPIPPTGSPGALVRSDFARMFKQAFPRHQERPALIEAISGITPSDTTNVPKLLTDGLRATEALYFWLGGFSDDPQYPLSGEGGPSFVDNGAAGDETLESRKARYEFDLARLAPRDDNGAFTGRFLNYQDPRDNAIKRRINFWEYRPQGSEVPLVYFDVSRHKPAAYDGWAVNPTGGATEVYALKQYREGVAPGTAGAAGRLLVFIDQGKYQILHPGLDDDWGTDFAGMKVAGTTTQAENVTVYPTGPFIGPIADTLTSFTDGTIEDAVEE